MKTYAGNLIVAVCLLCASSNSLSQVNLEWINVFDGVGHHDDEATDFVVDSIGNSYVCGYTRGGYYNNYDMVVLKYDSLGNSVWKRIYGYRDGGSDGARLIELGSDGNIYVEGYSSGISSNDQDFSILKYSQTGDLIRSIRYYSSSGDYINFNDMKLDEKGNIYLTGYTQLNDYNQEDIVTFKYDSAGNLQWIKFFNDTASLDDWGRSLTVDKSGNVFVAGSCQVSGAINDILLIKYDSTGNQIWTRKYDNVYSGNDIPISLTMDLQGNPIVLGHSEKVNNDNDFLLMNYMQNGDLDWARTYDRDSLNDIPVAMGLDSSGNTFVTGRSGDAISEDIVTLKYDSTGNLVWNRIFSRSSNSYDDPSGIVVEKEGEVYICGSSKIAGSNTDVLCLRYNFMGILQWVQYYNSPQNKTEYAISLGLDNDRNVYVTGNSSIQYVGSYDILTIKYHQSNPFIRVSLKVLNEGLYSSVFNMLARKDTVTVYLANATSPFAIVDSSKSVIDSLNFTGVFTFQNAPSGIYYLIVKHFNSIVTWSKAGGIFFSRDFSTHSYDFTTSASQAYGNNLKLKGGKYCIFSGDVFQDGFIDGSDLLVIDNDAYIFATGRFLPSDLNGDGFTDAQDMLIADNNRSREVIRP